MIVDCRFQICTANAARRTSIWYLQSNFQILKSILKSEIALQYALTPQLKRALADRIRYYNELGIYDFYRRDGEQQIQIQPEQREPLPKAKAAAIIPS